MTKSVSFVDPFAVTAARARAGSSGGAPGSYTYTLVRSGPDVSPDEVELPHAPAIEVLVLWGSNVLQVSHLSPPRNYYVGEELGKKHACDFFVPAEKLGTMRLPLVIGDRLSSAVVIPSGALGSIDLPGQGTISIEEARRRGRPCAELEGAYELPLPHGARARIELGEITFQIAAVNAGKPVAHGITSAIDWDVLSYFGLSTLSIAGLITAMAFFVPPLGLSSDDEANQDQLYVIHQYLQASAERELEAQAAEQGADKATEAGESGEQAMNEAGSLGNETSKETNKRVAIRGPAENPEPHLARREALRDAMEFGMVGMLNTIAADSHAPTAPWGQETALGSDALSALGNIWGDEIGDAIGAGGLSLSGSGDGGGGPGKGIALGSIGTLDHGGGGGSKPGFGPGTGNVGGLHRPKEMQVRTGPTTVSGRIPAEVIQRIVRQNYGRFRLCYEQGLLRNPNLEGRAVVRFVIGRDGSVSNASNGGSDLPDAAVIQCTVQAYYGLSFPPPTDGIVTVEYPILFSPG